MPDNLLITFRAPKPHVEIDQTALEAAENEFRLDGYEVVLVAEEKYPVSHSWAELAVNTLGPFLLGAAGKHYFEKVLNVFDAFVKKGVTVLNLCVRSGERHVYKDVPLRDLEAAKKALGDAFFELSIAVEHPETTIYWLEKVTITEDGTISLVTSGWNGASSWSKLKVVESNTQDYAFWLWLVGERGIRQRITDVEIAKFRSEFQAMHE